MRPDDLSEGVVLEKNLNETLRTKGAVERIISGLNLVDIKKYQK